MWVGCKEVGGGREVGRWVGGVGIPLFELENTKNVHFMFFNILSEHSSLRRDDQTDLDHFPARAFFKLCDSQDSDFT